MSTLKARLIDDMKTAMKSGEKNLLGVIRLINAAIKQREVDERILLDDTQVIAAIEKMIKQRKDSISQYLAAARTDLVDVEQYELGVLQTYLPAQLASAEVETIVVAAISATGAASAKDMGKVIALVKPQLAGRADMGKVSELIKQKLAAL